MKTALSIIRFMKLSIVKAPTSVLEKAFDLRRYAVTYAAPYRNSRNILALKELHDILSARKYFRSFKALWKAFHKWIRAMKSSGFNIEDTHLRDIDRIARLTAMVCIALAWAYLVGEHKDINVKAIRILKHGKRAKSLIKYGLEEIANVLLRPLYKPKFDVFKFLSCT